MLASELIKTYEEFCPQEFSMEGDVVGLQIGSLDKEIQKVMVTLDVRENTVAEAIEKGVDLIIAKHALSSVRLRTWCLHRIVIFYLTWLSTTLLSMSAIPILMSLMMALMIGSASYLTLKTPLI